MNDKLLKDKTTTAKSKIAIHLCNMGLGSFPSTLLSLSHLKVINLGTNNIEAIPEAISAFKGLTVASPDQQLFLNHNPLQSVPVALTECRYLQVLNISFTYVKILPIEVCHLKQLFDLNLDGCPLADPLAQVYPRGVLALMKHYQDKLEREKYREKL